jgi:hypothetical protein
MNIQSLRRGRLGAVPAVAGVLLVLGLGTAVDPGVAGAATPTVTITPAPTGGMYSDQESVSVSVGPNSLFNPYSKVVIIECADPLGTAANLPTSFSSCDGDTRQSDTVLVQPDGSFSESNYELFAVPNAVLEEQANWTPVCNKTHECVLYVGEDFNDFSKPKIFSKPFLFTSDPATIGGGGLANSVPGPSSASASGSPSTTGPSAAVSIGASTLAFTGLPSSAPWLVAMGVGLVALGTAARRVARRRGR